MTNYQCWACGWVRRVKEPAPKPLVSAGPRVINMWEHNGWGNSVRWWTPPSGPKLIGRIYGHMRHPKPKPGDLVACPMQSGKTALFKIRKRNYDSKTDPGDMFFADVKFIRYQEDTP